jgi:hypothetical protein
MPEKKPICIVVKSVLVTLSPQEYNEIIKYVRLQSPHIYHMIQVYFFEDGSIEVKNV